MTNKKNARTLTLVELSRVNGFPKFDDSEYPTHRLVSSR